ncbi:hypothetical protein LSTR_LSTR003936 [Laodelphax striatellus]|uniref:Peptidase S1 domain-containing protein n=1 Tax=Laodelphax striatellus TaxID=195883 RepID=A0A482XA28_LAOST|nr:hypothetical protein LSTR_LSTR003936 [Laodelphax striatellus]
MFHKSYFMVVLLTSFFGNKYEPKESIEGSGQSIVNVKCYDSNKILQKDFAVCFDGQWYPSDHTCEQKKCDAIYNTSTELYSCTTPEGVPVSCQQPSLPGTKITIRCDSKYFTTDNTTIQQKICLGSGEWENWSGCEFKQKECGAIYDISTELYTCSSPEGVPVSCQPPSLPGTKITIRCDSKYSTTDHKTIQQKICLGSGEWENWSRCEFKQKECGAIYDISTERYTCSSPEGVPVSCQQPSLPGTKITIRCDSKYFTTDNTTIQQKICLESGEWEKWSRCELQCGPVFNNDSSTEKNNYVSNVLSEYPWHTVIYLKKNGEWHQHCVGTLVSNFVVLTAESCVENMSPGDLFRRGFDWSGGFESEEGHLKIAVGKYYRDYRSNEASSSQMYDVVNFYQMSNIALLIVGMYIEFSDTARSVLLDDVMGNVDEEIGHIVAWDKDETGSMARVAKSIRCESNEICRSSTEINNIRLWPTDIFKVTKGPLWRDEFCSLSKQHAFVAGDIGSGLVYQKADGRFYLRGILSELYLGGKIPIFVSTTDRAKRDFIIRDSGFLVQATLPSRPTANLNGVPYSRFN